MTSRRSFILVITRYASALDNEMSVAAKRGYRYRSRDRAARDREGSITGRVGDCEYDRRSTAKRGKKEQQIRRIRIKLMVG